MKALLNKRRVMGCALTICLAGAMFARADAYAPSATTTGSGVTPRTRSEVPESANMLLLGSGLVGLGIIVRRGLARRRD